MTTVSAAYQRKAMTGGQLETLAVIAGMTMVANDNDEPVGRTVCGAIVALISIAATMVALVYALAGMLPR